MANFIQKLFGNPQTLEQRVSSSVVKTLEELELRGHLPYSPNPYSIQNKISFFDQTLENGAVQHYALNTTDNITRALTNCPAVPYIINKKARAFCSGIITATKNGEPVSGMDMVYQEIIDKPNFLQTGYQFKMQNYAQVQSYGYSVCLKVYAGSQLSSVWALPSAKVKIEWEAGWFPFKRQSIKSAIKQILFCDEVIDKNNVYIFTDSTPCEAGMIIPPSRLRPLMYPIDNLIINYESRGKLMNKPMGLITNTQSDNISGMDLDPVEIEALHKQFDKYGLSANQRRFIITGANVDWKPISFPLSDMQMDIFERNDTITIAEGLDYPPFLLGLSDKGIYNNVSEAYKALYTGSIIPDGENYVQQQDQCFDAAKRGIKYKIDFSHLAVLQEGLKYKNEARKILVETLAFQFEKNMITYGRMMELAEEQNYNTDWTDLYSYQMPFNEVKKPEQLTPPKNETKK